MRSRYQKSLFALGLVTIIALLCFVIFRITVTIQSINYSHGFFSITTIFLFFLAELFVLLHSTGYFINILTSLFYYTRENISYAQIKNFPAVDVLIPVHDEPTQIVFKTIVAAQHIDYPNYRIIIIDSSSTPKAMKAMADLAHSRNVDYYAVPKPRHGAKAGAINECLKDLRAPYLAIFDADYRPSRDFLKLTIPQMMASTDLGFIQTPQFYGNLKAIPVSRAAQMQQSIFYEYICEGKSIRSAMFMCGTNLLVRTEALRSVGGFVENSITEDFATSLQIIMSGWKTSYYNNTTAFGDGPRNLREFFRQQYRWARGTLGIFFTKLPTLLFSPKLSFGQRIEFLLSGSYYMVGLVWIILLIMPIVYILTGTPAYMANPVFYFLAYIPYFLLSLTLFFQTLFNRHYRLSDWFITESLALLTAPVYARATFDALFNRKSTFEKTRKDAQITEIPWDMLGFQLLLIYGSIFALGFGAIKILIWQNPVSVALLVNLFWCAFHLLFLSYFLLYANFQKSSTKHR